MESVVYIFEFICDLKGSDFLYWGEGMVSVILMQVVYMGSLVFGLDYKFYLVLEFVDDEVLFLVVKDVVV